MRYSKKFWKDWDNSNYFDRLKMLKELAATEHQDLNAMQMDFIYNSLRDIKDWEENHCKRKVSYWKVRYEKNRRKD